MNCSFIIPCFNEKPDVLKTLTDNLSGVLNRISGLTYEIIIINDGSTKYKYPQFNSGNIKIITHSHNKGYGASILTGILSAKSEWIGITDADGTYPVEYFEEFLKYTDDFDMIVGRRSWNDIQLIRRAPKYILQKIASFIADCDIPELNSGMRMFKKETVEKFIRLFPQRFSFTTTLTMICMTNYFNVKFIDIPYYKRSGYSNIHPIKDTIKFFSLVMRLALYFKPLRFFVPLSSFITILALLRSVRDMLLTNHLGGLALVLFFMAFQVFFFGLIAEIINKK
jgi:glycosyltransferase involved in cell wall biosynthesis